ncbi:small-conductance mechanosensitive channel [Xenococcus sp. PCC 7305]|uniref:mechanosensitive ion channel family protein n=1 Tax=Xenococcus sp. PCC 7305 TaxID=102125 RepID=UPI0002AD1A27|nr:mechanosensitive ion channel family protein [Xenococcus sp. PCC 7305]ELS04132.1 small-conductance mechanosensitive channel [Xenococcus sp. PCC 7305]
MLNFSYLFLGQSTKLNRSRKFPLTITFFAVVTLSLGTVTLAFAQEEEIIPIPSKSESAIIPGDGLYFADVVVRNRPLFQIGSLPQIDASARAQIINRRLASLLAQNENPGKVEIAPDEPRKIATLRLNNRILMTVTQQDAEDFGLSTDELAEKWAEQLNNAFAQPPLAIDVTQRLYTTTRELLRDLVGNLPSLVGAIIVVGLTWAVAKGVRYLAFTWAQQTEGDSSTELLIGRLSYGAVWVVGFIIALGVMGLDFGALLGALGLTSVAIGFSLKDVLSNYISGVILLAARPFRIHDQVVIDDYEGTITQIQLRATTMKTYDGRLVYIPNQEVFQASIINNTASPKRRSSVMVGIDYEEDIDKAIAVIHQALQNLKEVETQPQPDILVKELAASTVNLEVRFWVDSHRAGFLATTSKVTQAVKEALEKANIDMPTDIYTLIMRELPSPVTANKIN